MPVATGRLGTATHPQRRRSTAVRERPGHLMDRIETSYYNIAIYLYAGLPQLRVWQRFSLPSAAMSTFL